MAYIQLTDQNFDDIIQKNSIVIIDFWAEWCAPCQSFGKIFEMVSKEFPELMFAQVNIESEPDLQEAFHINSIPHVVIFKDEVVIFSEAGLLSAPALRDLIEQAKNVDVSRLK